MKWTAIILVLAVWAGPGAPVPYHPDSWLDSVSRDENGYISIRDLGSLLSDMCGQLSVFKQTLASDVTAGYGAAILESPLPLPNLGALDFLGVIKLVTQGLGLAMDKVTETVGANGVPQSTASDAALETTTAGSTKFLLTVGDVVDMAEYLCKVVNLVAAILNNKLFDMLHINRITIPLNDPRHPTPDLNFLDKLDILNLQGLAKGVGGALTGAYGAISCLWGCSEAETTTGATINADDYKAPEKPSVFDDLSSYYNR